MTHNYTARWESGRGIDTQIDTQFQFRRSIAGDFVWDCAFVLDWEGMVILGWW